MPGLAAREGEVPCRVDDVSIDQQIADMQRRLDQQRALLTSSFIAMESAQSRIQQQSSAITNAFGMNNSNSK